MKMSVECIRCIVDAQARQAEHMKEEEVKRSYLRRVLGMLSGCGEEVTAPAIVRQIEDLYVQMGGPLQDFTQIKKEYNECMLQLEQEIERKIEAAPDSLAMALAYARAGNYIDFASGHAVDRATLLSLLEQQSLQAVDETVYREFLQDLSKARQFVFLLDNCGEIVLDKLVLKQLKKRFPNVSLTAFVRGYPTSNDVTLDDAEQTGLKEVAHVISNGSPVAGTDMGTMSDSAVKLLKQADIILSKGQGNYETLSGCGLNVYYLFLIKCSCFQKLFENPIHTGMFVREERIIC